MATRTRGDDLGERDLRGSTPGRERSAAPSTSLSTASLSILRLQRTAGNAAVVSLLRPQPEARFLQRDEDDDEVTGEGEAGSAGEAGTTETAGGEQASAGDAAQPEASSQAGEPAGGDDGGYVPEGGGEPEPASEDGGSGAEGEGPVIDAGDGTPAHGGDEAPAPEEGEDDGGGGSASGSGEGPAVDDGDGGDGGDGDGGGGADGGDSDENPDGYTPEQIARKLAEGDDVTAEDPLVPTAGGAPPSAVSAGAGFHDGGRRATVPFGSADPAAESPEEAMHPHAYTGGGRTGSVPWSGGGVGAGPKGNQGSASIQTESVPKYDTRSNGPFSKADAWVIPGSAVASVNRDYVASNAGDQGNGWWISSLAASALELHEQRHVNSTREVYASTIQPALDRTADSEAHGKGQMYWASDAIALLSRWIGWKSALDSFKEQDASWNAPSGEIDQRDYGSSGYPRNMKGPRTIGGKEYQNYLIMGSESDPT